MPGNYVAISDYKGWTSEDNGTDDQCDLTGYVDTATYISQMLEAGIMLDQVRRGEYDYDGDDDDQDPDIDPLRAPWTDPSDVDNFASGLEQSLANKKAAAEKAKANQQAPAKASDHEQSYDLPDDNDPESPTIRKVVPNGGQDAQKKT